MEKFDNLVCSTIKTLHDLSSDRREPDRFLSIKDYNIFVRKDFINIIYSYY
jgi:hypothetical protein